MILTNRRTRKTLEIEYPEFRKRIASRVRNGQGVEPCRADTFSASNQAKFAKEIQISFESYRQTQLNKHFYNFQDDNSIEFNFTFKFSITCGLRAEAVGVCEGKYRNAV